ISSPRLVTFGLENSRLARERVNSTTKLLCIFAEASNNATGGLFTKRSTTPPTSTSWLGKSGWLTLVQGRIAPWIPWFFTQFTKLSELLVAGTFGAVFLVVSEMVGIHQEGVTKLNFPAW